MTDPQVINGRLKKRIEKLRKQRDYWQDRCTHYAAVIQQHPHIERHFYDWEKREAERKRVKDLEQRIKEQALLIEKLTQEKT